MKKGLSTFFLVIYLFISQAQIYHYKTGKVIPHDKSGLVDFKQGVFNSYPAEYAILLAPEYRKNNKSKLISIPVIRIKSYDSDSSSFPIFLLYGGPGESNLKPDMINDELLKYHDHILIGYRGVDGSVQLKCNNVKENLFSDKLTCKNSEDNFSESLEQCLIQIKKQGYNPKGYSVNEVVEDIEQVRSELGYPKIAFEAFSYGTILAQNYALKHKEKTIKLALLGPRPLNNMAIDGNTLNNQLYLFHQYYQQNVMGKTPDSKEKALAELYLRLTNLIPDNAKFNIPRLYIFIFSQLYTLNRIEQFFTATANTLIGDTTLLQKYYNEFYNEYPKGIFLGDMYLKKQGKIKLDTSANKETIGNILAKQINNWYSPSHKFLIDTANQAQDTVITPALFICGDMDVAAPPELIKQIIPYYTNSTYKELIYTGHLDFFFTQKAYVDSLLIDFFKE